MSSKPQAWNQSSASTSGRIQRSEPWSKGLGGENHSDPCLPGTCSDICFAGASAACLRAPSAPAAPPMPLQVPLIGIVAARTQGSDQNFSAPPLVLGTGSILHLPCFYFTALEKWLDFFCAFRGKNSSPHQRGIPGYIREVS